MLETHQFKTVRLDKNLRHIVIRYLQEITFKYKDLYMIKLKGLKEM